MKTTPCFVMSLQLVMERVYPYVVLTEGSKKKGDGSNGSLQRRWTHNCHLLVAMASDMNSSTVQGIFSSPARPRHRSAGHTSNVARLHGAAKGN